MEIDLILLENKSLFQNIHQQSELIQEICLDVSNSFPQKLLLESHPNAKGTKFSKGYNLENAPYQVLDLVRDFDLLNGFNIRILNWWGEGMYIFTYYGEQTYIRNKNSISKLLQNYRNCNHSSPWAYSEIISNHKQKKQDKSDQLNVKRDFFQLFKNIELDVDSGKTCTLIKKEIKFILDNHV